MRFKSKLLNEKINLFAKIVSTLIKSAKEVVIHLTALKAQFIVQETTENSVQIWSGIPAQGLFDNYVVESVNNNEIAFKVNLDHLAKAFKSGHNAADLTLKLAKKGGHPFLSLIVGGTQQGEMAVVQDVPVIVLSANDLQTFIEPSLPDPEVHILMPSLKALRHVINAMKSHSDTLEIRATMNGDLTFSVETESVTIKTFYRHLDHPIIEGREETQNNESTPRNAAVKVSIKLFSKFLFSYQVLPTNVILCLIEDRAVVIHVLLDDLYLTYYIPVISTG